MIGADRETRDPTGAQVKPASRAAIVACGAVALAVVLLVNGAVPGLLAPTGAQLIWMTGFAQSFINDGFSIYSHNFGLPMPAPMAFGVVAALPISGLLALGVTPADAYTATFAVWLTVAFSGAFRFARYLGTGPFSAVAAALVWCTFPMVWEHQHFSAVALGIALLPLYFLASLPVVSTDTGARQISVLFAACLLAVFMDGYTFVMFASGSAIALALAMKRATWKALLLRRGLPLALAFGFAYSAYAIYQGIPDFGGQPLDFFRGWAVSIEFIFIPTAKVLALADALGLSDARSNAEYFGDDSTFLTTFAAVITLVAVYGLARRAGDRASLVLFAAIAAFGLYMALGPTVKFLTYRPEEMGQLMPSEYGLFPTGNGLISRYLPGFKNMRASYRWLALFMFGCWAIFVLLLASRRLTTVSTVAICGALLAFNVPSGSRFTQYERFRTLAVTIEAEVAAWRQYLHEGERVLFAPYGNDFMVNYAASKLRLRAYNAGGDKNMELAVRFWPPTLKRFQYETIGPDFERKVRAVLENGDADAVVLPYISLLRSAYRWPVANEAKDELAAIAGQLGQNPRYTVEHAPYFAVVRLKDGLPGLGDAAVWAEEPPR